MCGGGCFGMGSLPNVVGRMIAELKTGDDIIIPAGQAGVIEDTVDIVLHVNGASAVTAKGNLLSCLNVSELIVVGTHRDEFMIHPKAVEIMRISQERERQLAAEDEADLFADLD